MRGLPAQRLSYAIAASLLAHVLILWPDSLRVLTRDAPALIHATLQQRPPAPQKEPAPPELARAVARAQGGFAGTRSEPAPTLAVPVRQPGLPLSKPAIGSEPVPMVETMRAPAMVAGMAGGALLTEANASGEAVDGLRGYRLAVATQARRFKRYPAQAMSSGWTGSAEIRVEVGSDGRPRAAALIRSSGHELLDQAALAMIDAGAAHARLPESLRGSPFAVVLPVVFDLADE